MTTRAIRVFFGKEVRESLKTYRFYVLLGALIFFGLTSPIIAKLTPDLIKTSLPSGIQLTIPAPTYEDAYLGFMKNLSQLGIIVLILVSMGLVAEEKARGTAVLALIRPLTRTAFIVVKYVVLLATTAASVVIAATGSYLYTLALFDGVQLGGFPPAVAAWLLFAGMILAATTMFSTIMPNQMSAAGVSFALFILIYAVPALGHGLDKYSPGALLTKGGPVAVGTLEATILVWPALTAAALTFAFLALAAALFRRQEL